jgi:hypothetical protein
MNQRKEFNHNFFGVIMLLGGLIYLTTNVFWKLIPNKNVGEWLYFFGLFLGTVCFITICKEYFKNKSFSFYLVSDFFLTLSWSKLFTQCILNPLEYQISEFWGLGLAIIVLIYRSNKKK